MAKYSSYSPYFSTDQTYGHLGVMNFRTIPSLTNDILFTITKTYEHRPDLLSYDLYQTVQLWWVFAARNPNKLGPDPYFNLVGGIGIYIPTLITLQLALGI
jgi:hypothetical protein